MYTVFCRRRGELLWNNIIHILPQTYCTICIDSCRYENIFSFLVILSLYFNSSIDVFGSKMMNTITEKSLYWMTSWITSAMISCSYKTDTIYRLVYGYVSQPKSRIYECFRGKNWPSTKIPCIHCDYYKYYKLSSRKCYSHFKTTAVQKPTNSNVSDMSLHSTKFGFVRKEYKITGSIYLFKTANFLVDITFLRVVIIFLVDITFLRVVIILSLIHI